MLVAGIGKKLWITITGFTIAHSITLALSALDVVRLPIPPVEAVIALSVVYLAMEIALQKKDSLTYRYPYSGIFIFWAPAWLWFCCCSF